MPDRSSNPDRAQVRDLGAVDPRPADGDRETARLRDEIAYLTRDRDLWRGRAEISMLSNCRRCGGAA
jgi:hypothetical protein